MNMRKGISLIALLLLGTYLKAQTGTITNNFSAADKKIIDFMADWSISGGQAAITKNGKLIYNKAFGYSDQRKSKPAATDDLYRIASVSKPITAIGIMKLIEDGQLSLDTKVFGNILDQPYYLNAISDKRIYEITVQQLLEHTAGWNRNIPCDGYSHSDPAFFPLHVTSVLEEANPVGDSTLIKFLVKKGLNNSPGTSYSYSNVGYLVLGKIIEKISGMSYEKYIQEAVLKPAGVKDIYLGKNLLSGKQPREADYIGSSTTLSCYGDGTRVPWQYGGFNVEAMNAHGGWIATAADLTKLILAADGFSTAPDILKSELIKLMAEPADLNANYAKGWCVNKSNNWWHTGSMDGTASFICRTADGYTWAFLFNSRSSNSNAFWQAFDRLPWECLKVIKNVPMVN